MRNEDFAEIITAVIKKLGFEIVIFISIDRARPELTWTVLKSNPEKGWFNLLGSCRHGQRYQRVQGLPRIGIQGRLPSRQRLPL